MSRKQADPARARRSAPSPRSSSDCSRRRRPRQQVHAAAEGLHRVRRIWVVGTGTSQHAAALGAGDAPGRRARAHAVSSMQFVGTRRSWARTTASS